MITSKIGRGVMCNINKITKTIKQAASLGKKEMLYIIKLNAGC